MELLQDNIYQGMRWKMSEEFNMFSRRTGRQWRKLYYNYTRHYNKRNKELITKYGVGMADSKLDYWSFREAFAVTENGRLEEQQAGYRGKSINVMRDILNEQTYKRSYKQGRALLKAQKEFIQGKINEERQKSKPNKDLINELKEKKKSLNLFNVRMDRVDLSELQDALTAFNNELKMNPDYADDGYARAEAIATSFFGSA